TCAVHLGVTCSGPTRDSLGQATEGRWSGRRDEGRGGARRSAFVNARRRSAGPPDARIGVPSPKMRAGAPLLVTQHWDANAALVSHLDRALVAGVGVAHHTAARVIGQHALELFRRLVSTVRDHDHAGVDGAPDADAAAVV